MVSARSLRSRWPPSTRGGSPMRESRTYGSVRGALSNERPYRDHSIDRLRARRNHRTDQGSLPSLPPSLIASAPEVDLFARLRAAESIGRPLGDDRFLSPHRATDRAIPQARQAWAEAVSTGKPRMSGIVVPRVEANA